MAILAQHITYEFAVRVQRQCDGQGEPFGLNLFYIFDPLCLIFIIIIIIIIVKMIMKRLQLAPLTTQWGWWLEKLVGATESLTLLHDSHSQACLFVVSFCCCCCHCFRHFLFPLQASWCSPPLTQLDTSQCSVSAMWWCPDFFSALSCAMMPTKEHRSLSWWSFAYRHAYKRA